MAELGSNGGAERAPVLILGIGNALLSDDAVGLKLLESLADRYRDDERVECVDGGTQGIMLLGVIEDRRAVLILDAISTGAEAGAIHSFRAADVLSSVGNAASAHEAGAADLIRSANLIGGLPDEVRVIGIEPAATHTSMEISAEVREAIGGAAEMAVRYVDEVLAGERVGVD